jgi:hypothetical protein
MFLNKVLRVFDELGRYCEKNKDVAINWLVKEENKHVTINWMVKEKNKDVTINWLVKPFGTCSEEVLS